MQRSPHMRVATCLLAIVLSACTKEKGAESDSATAQESARRTFAQFDQIAAFPTARPSKKGIRYELEIRNIGSEPLVGLYETIQQWQPLEKRPDDIAEWNEHLPMADGVGTFTLAPDEEFRCEVEPMYRTEVRLRFGFLVFCKVGDNDYRRLRVWTEPRTPDADFRGRLIGAPSQNEEAEQDGTGQPATRPLSDSEGSDKPQPESEGRSR